MIVLSFPVTSNPPPFFLLKKRKSRKELSCHKSFTLKLKKKDGIQKGMNQTNAHIFFKIIVV